MILRNLQNRKRGWPTHTRPWQRSAKIYRDRHALSTTDPPIRPRRPMCTTLHTLVWHPAPPPARSMFSLPTCLNCEWVQSMLFFFQKRNTTEHKREPAKRTMSVKGLRRKRCKHPCHTHTHTHTHTHNLQFSIRCQTISQITVVVKMKRFHTLFHTIHFNTHVAVIRGTRQFL
jgi:hypothetical protein